MLRLGQNCKSRFAISKANIYSNRTQNDENGLSNRKPKKSAGSQGAPRTTNPRGGGSQSRLKLGKPPAQPAHLAYPDNDNHAARRASCQKRMKSVVNGVTIYNVYDASGALIHVYNKSKNEKTDYISAGGMSVARVTNNVPTYLHNDHLGSAVSGTQASGAKAKRGQRHTPPSASRSKIPPQMITKPALRGTSRTRPQA